jgi:hypothetical protein
VKKRKETNAEPTRVSAVLNKQQKKVLKPCRDTKRTKIPEREERASETQQEGWLREAGEEGDAKPVRLSAAPMSRWSDQ